jgi:hypothetical protein
LAQCWGQFAGLPIVSVAQAHDQLMEMGADEHAGILASANSYVCPRGATPGHATILGTYENVSQSWQQLGFGSPLAFHNLTLGSDQNQISVDQMVFLSAEQVVPGAEKDPNALYICHLADIRWLMQRSTFYQAYNVRSLGNPTVEYWSDTEDPAAATLYNGNPGPGVGPWTWTKMLNNIWSLLPANATWPAAPGLSDATFLPNQNPERFRFIEDSPLSAYSEALRTIMCEVAYNPTNGGSFSVVELGSSDSNFQQLQNSLTGSLIDATNSLESLATWFPASVDVLFLALYSGTPEQAITEHPYYVLNVAPGSYPGGATPTPGSTDMIFAPLDAQMPCSGVTSAANWQATTAYNTGQKVQPVPANGHTYICTTSGTSGTTQPNWPTGTGSTVTDGGVTWTESTIYPTNYAAMLALATSLVANYIQMLDGTMRRKVWIYDGIQSFVPGSQVGQVEWRLGIDGATTTVSAVGV